MIPTDECDSNTKRMRLAGEGRWRLHGFLAAAAALAASVALTSPAHAQLLFEDNFNNESLTDSDEIEGFWEAWTASTLTENAGIFIEDGSLRITIEANNQNNRLMQYFSSEGHASFDFLDNPLVLEVNDIEFEDPEGEVSPDQRIFPIGFTSQATGTAASLWTRSSGVAYVRIDPGAGGALGIWAANADDDGHTELGSLAPPEGESLTDLTFALGETDFEVQTTYSDGSSDEWSGEHGLTGTWGVGHLNIQYFQSDGTSENHLSSVSIGRVAIDGVEVGPPPPSPEPPAEISPGWNMVDDFDTHHDILVGQTLYTVNGWEARRAADYSAASDPEDSENVVLATELNAGPNSWIRKRLGAAAIRDGETGTLFFRFFVPEGNDNPHQSVGMSPSDVDDPTSFGSMSGYIQIRETTEEEPGLFRHRIRDGTNTNVDTGQGDEGVWYSVWLVFDNDAKTYDGYIVEGARDATEDDLMGEGLGFRAETTHLDKFIVRLGGADLVYIDDVAVDPLQENLTVPVDAPPIPLAQPFVSEFDPDAYTAGEALDGQDNWLDVQIDDDSSPNHQVEPAGGSRPDSPSGSENLVVLESFWDSVGAVRPLRDERFPPERDWGDDGGRLMPLWHPFQVEVVAAYDDSSGGTYFGVDGGEAGRAFVGADGDAFVFQGVGEVQTLEGATPVAGTFYRYVVEVMPWDGATFNARVYGLDGDLLVSAEGQDGGSIPTSSESREYPRLLMALEQDQSDGPTVYVDSVSVSWIEIEVDDVFAAWQADHFTQEQLDDDSISGPFADPDGDGIANILEFAFAGDPLEPNRGVLPMLTTETYTVDGEEGEYLTITFVRRNELGAVNLEVESSEELGGGWSADAVEVSASDNGDGTVTEIWRDSVEQSASDRRFLRVNTSMD